jgi:DNA-binding PadR family transcriptional regulator
MNFPKTLNIIIDIKCDIKFDRRMRMFHGSFRHLMRHTAAVPKGFLRYYVLKLLNEKPMSGSEIISEIEKRTNGCWKPSPGSIYPLMAWLQEEGYIKETAEKETGIKRYTLTDKGKAFLEEHIKKKEELRKRFRFFMPPLLELTPPPWLDFPEKARDLAEARIRLAKAMWDFREKLEETYSENAVNEAKEALEKATEKIEEITKKLKR